MFDAQDDDTQGIESAKETREMVFGAALKLAKRTIEHVDSFEELRHAYLEDRLDCGGFEWHIVADYGRGQAFVRVTGHPHVTGDSPLAKGVISSPEEMAAVMQGNSAAFNSNLPRTWVEHAYKYSMAVFGTGDDDADAGDIVPVRVGDKQ